MERLLHKYIRMLARYNAWANARLYESCGGLEGASVAVELEDASFADELAGVSSADELADVSSADELADVSSADALAGVSSADELAGVVSADELVGVISVRELEDASASGDEVEARHLLLELLNARLAADKRWRARLQGYATDRAALDGDLYESLALLRDAQLAEDLLLSEHVHTLSEEDLLRPIPYHDDADEPHASSAYELLTQLLVEQIDTRGRANALLERAGLAAPDLTVLSFVRDVYPAGEALSH